MKLMLFLFCTILLAREPISSDRLEHLSGVKQNKDVQGQWDSRYSRNAFIYGKSPAKFLAENYHYLKPNSLVLDMGMGEGRNAVFLAQKGHRVTGIDISSVAIKKAKMLAKEYAVTITSIVASMETYQIAPESFDAIICFYYVDRTLLKKMKSWLKPGGILMYEGHTLKQRALQKFAKDPESYFLKAGELLTMFEGMQILKYEEPLHLDEFRASIILQKAK